MIKAACILLTGFFLFAYSSSIAQQGKPVKGLDSVEVVRKQAKRLVDERLKENIEAYRESRAVTIQRQRLNNLRRYSNKIDAYFKRGLDTTGVQAKTRILEAAFNDVVTSSTEVPYPFLSYRNLTAAELLLNELLTQVGEEQRKMRNHLDELQTMQLGLDSLIMDTSIYVIPADDQKFQFVVLALMSINKKIKPMDSLLQVTTNRVMELDITLSGLKTRIESEFHQIGFERGQLASSLLRQEVPYLWQPFQESHSIMEVIKPSYKRAQQMLYYFFMNNSQKLKLMFLLYAIGFLFIFWCKRSIRLQGKSGGRYEDNLAFHFPLISVSLVIFNAVQFLFLNPPFIFQVIIWLASTIFMIVLLGSKARVFSNKILLGVIFFLTPVILMNLLLEPTNTERWLIFVLALVAIPYSYFLWKQKANYKMSKQLIKSMLILFIVCEVGAVAFISFGRFNLAETLLTAGYFSLVSALFLVWAEFILHRLIELVADAFDTFEQRDVRLKVLKFHERVKKFIHVLVYGGIALLFLRNFYLYDTIMNWVNDFFLQERNIGDTTFTWMNILIFIVVIVISSLLSSLVAFLFDDSMVTNRERGKGGIRNWALLIRLCVIVFGFFMAFAAAGIAMDKVTIIIGALGVGIGFGLQTIVNNLFSGIILAFERPIEIGDQIEVAGRVGRVNAIGIRSSKLQSFDGSEVIIPNGDLLSQHVVNWTLSNNHRRVELLIGVKYGTDLLIVKKILEEVIQENERVEKYPLQQVLLKKFDDSAITFQLFFWTDIRYWMDVKSEVILSIDKAFKEKGIEIPFNQLDVHVHTNTEVSKKE